MSVVFYRGDGAGEYVSTYRNQVLEAVLHENTAASDYYLLQTPFSGSQHAKGARLFSFFCGGGGLEGDH